VGNSLQQDPMQFSICKGAIDCSTRKREHTTLKMWVNVKLRVMREFRQLSLRLLGKASLERFLSFPASEG